MGGHIKKAILSFKMNTFKRTFLANYGICIDKVYMNMNRREVEIYLAGKDLYQLAVRPNLTISCHLTNILISLFFWCIISYDSWQKSYYQILAYFK